MIGPGAGRQGLMSRLLTIAVAIGDDYRDITGTGKVLWPRLRQHRDTAPGPRLNAALLICERIPRTERSFTRKAQMAAAALTTVRRTEARYRYVPRETLMQDAFGLHRNAQIDDAGGRCPWQIINVPALSFIVAQMTAQSSFHSAPGAGGIPVQTAEKHVLSLGYADLFSCLRFESALFARQGALLSQRIP